MTCLVSSLLLLCLNCVQLSQGMGMLSLDQQRLVTNFLSLKQSSAPELTLLPSKQEHLPAKQEHEDVEAEVALERAQYTETGQSWREKELLANIGRLEDQLEGYRRLGPDLHAHFQMQESTKQTLTELQQKTIKIEEATATLWWDCKVLMCIVVVFGAALCIYVSSLHARQNSQQPWPPQRKLFDGKFEAASLSDELTMDFQPSEVKYFNMAEEHSPRDGSDPLYCDHDGMGDAATPDEWWVQPCGKRSTDRRSTL